MTKIKIDNGRIAQRLECTIIPIFKKTKQITRKQKTTTT